MTTNNYDRVLFSPTKDGNDAVATLREGEWADVKVTIIGGSLEGLTGGLLIKVEELSETSRRSASSTPRSPAPMPLAAGRSEPGFTGDFAEYVAQNFPTATAADFAVLEAGIVSEETYVEQGLYWATGHHPIIEYVLSTYRPDLAMVGMPTTDEFSHQFLGLISKTLPDGAPNPAYDDVKLDGTSLTVVCGTRGIHPRRVRRRRRHDAARAIAVERQEHDDVRCLGPRLRAAVPCHRREQGARRPRAPVDAADVQLPPATARPSARPRRVGPAARCRST